MKPKPSLARCRSALLALAFLLAPPSILLSQGPLTPPGAPAPVMKTLQQVEPRTPLEAGQAGVDATNGSYHFIINQPGSYYLSAHVNVTKANGIQINAVGVTLDLGGFTVARSSGTGGFGVDVAAPITGASVRNGALRGFGFGVRGLGPDMVLRDLTATACTTVGLQVGDGGIIESCRAFSNPGDYGFLCDTGSVISHCTVRGNTGTYGIFLGNGSTISHCAIDSNTVSFGVYSGTGCTVQHCSVNTHTSSSAFSGGISVNSGSLVSHCTVRSSTTTATATATTGVGIYVNAAATVEHCTVSGNAGSGIYVPGDGNHILHNTVVGNAASVTGGNIHLAADASGNRIDSNHSQMTQRGFFLEGNDNLVVRNSAQGSTVANYDIAAGNHDAARVTSPGAAFASTSPWANFSY